MTSPKPKPPPAPDGWTEWEAGALDREIDQLFNWRFYCEAEDRSMDRLLAELRSDRNEAKRPKRCPPRKTEK